MRKSRGLITAVEPSRPVIKYLKHEMCVVLPDTSRSVWSPCRSVVLYLCISVSLIARKSAPWKMYKKHHYIDSILVRIVQYLPHIIVNQW